MMQSIHYSQTLLSDEFYNECQIKLEFLGGSFTAIAIDPGTYNDLFELVEALNIAISSSTIGGTATVNESGLVTLAASLPFKVVTHQDSDNVLRYDSLPLLLGFSKQSEVFSTLQCAEQTAEIAFFRESFSDLSTSTLSSYVHSAKGLHGKSKSVGFSSRESNVLEISYLKLKEFTHLYRWYETASKGRNIRVFIDSENYIDFNLATKSMQSSRNVFKQINQTGQLWSAHFDLIGV